MDALLKHGILEVPANLFPSVDSELMGLMFLLISIIDQGSEIKIAQEFLNNLKLTKILVFGFSGGNPRYLASGITRAELPYLPLLAPTVYNQNDGDRNTIPRETFLDLQLSHRSSKIDSS